MYWRIFIPQSLVKRVIENLHSNNLSGHLGVHKTYWRIEEQAY